MNGKCSGESLVNPFADSQGVFGLFAIRKNNNEFITPHTGYGVRLTHYRLETRSRFLKDLVAGEVSQ